MMSRTIISLSKYNFLIPLFQNNYTDEDSNYRLIEKPITIYTLSSAKKKIIKCFLEVEIKQQDS